MEWPTESKTVCVLYPSQYLLLTIGQRESKYEQVQENTVTKYYLYRTEIWITYISHSTYQTSKEAWWERVDVVFLFRGNFWTSMKRMRLKKKVKISVRIFLVRIDLRLYTRIISGIITVIFFVDCWQTKKIFSWKKMTTLTVCNRIESGKSEKVKLNSINFKSSVQNLKDGISKKIKRPVSDFGEYWIFSFFFSDIQLSIRKFDILSKP